MHTIFNRPLVRSASLCATLLFSGLLNAQSPAVRFKNQVNDSERVTIAGTHHPLATAEADAGALPDGTHLAGMTIVFNRSASQQADLEALLAAQQDPSSASYHQWLTADQFAARFGMATADLSAVTSWLGTQGFTVGDISRGRDRISFSGSAAQFASAFGTSLHYFNVGGRKHFAPAGDVNVPAAFASSILSVENVTDFSATSHMIRKGPTPAFTSSQTGNHYLTPQDLATIYDVTPAYNAGYTGVGQSIAVIGQSAVLTSDITNFQNAAGTPVRAPNYVLVPSTGASTINPLGTSAGDEEESDLDLEYSGAMGQGATIYFVYTGSNTNYGVYDALNYAIANQVAQIITLSYGTCETQLSISEYNTITAELAQASSQGETVINSSGDQGSTACYGSGSTSSQASVSVSFPASSQYVTGVGGTEFAAANVAAGNNTYFTAAPSTDVIGSAISYIPEIAWNDDTSSGLSAGGGGTSIDTARPSWQVGVTGIPSGSFRLVPDVSLAASPANPGYLYCSSDTSALQNSGQVGSCQSGFRDSNNHYLTVAGGTSFAAPAFAGMLSIIAQKVNSTGLGVINPTLYTLAQNSTNYSTAFHDITSGTIACTGVSICNAANSAATFATTAGYDVATGLGSIDLYNLMVAWPGGSTLPGSKVTLTPAAASVPINTNDVITISVAPVLTSSTAATGTVTIKVDGISQGTIPLTNGTATYTFASSSSGSHIVTVTYSGNATLSASSNSLTIVVAAVGGFTISAPALTITDGSTGIETISLTSNNGYTGTVGFTVSTTSSISNTCFSFSSAKVTTANTTIQSSLTINTSSAYCSGATPLVSSVAALAPVRPGPAVPSAPVGISLAGLLAIGVLGRRSRKLRAFVIAALLTVAGFGLSGCGDNTASTTGTLNAIAPAGAYTVTVTATDSNTPSITASTTFTLTIH